MIKPETTGKIKIGISSCLFGNPVRYDGANAYDPYITNTLGQYMQFVPICPESEAGLGVPREPMRLVGNPESPRLVTVKTGRDMTRKVLMWAMKRVRQLESEGLSGFIFKSRSPACGMERVSIYTEKGLPVKKGVGVFAKTFKELFPLIPCEEDGRLHDPDIRENFIERVFTLHRWRRCLAQGKRLGRLIEFHSIHKYLTLSHSQKHYREMDRLIGEAKGSKTSDLYARYGQLLIKALSLKASVKKHTNVLKQMMGCLDKRLSRDEESELLEAIESYSEGTVPLIVPVTLINHYVRKYDQPYLKDQVYLRPHPLELRLRNHA